MNKFVNLGEKERQSNKKTTEQAVESQASENTCLFENDDSGRGAQNLCTQWN